MKSQKQKLREKIAELTQEKEKSALEAASKQKEQEKRVKELEQNIKSLKSQNNSLQNSNSLLKKEAENLRIESARRSIIPKEKYKEKEEKKKQNNNADREELKDNKDRAMNELSESTSKLAITSPPVAAASYSVRTMSGSGMNKDDNVQNNQYNTNIHNNSSIGLISNPNTLLLRDDRYPLSQSFPAYHLSDQSLSLRDRDRERDRDRDRDRDSEFQLQHQKEEEQIFCTGQIIQEIPASVSHTLRQMQFKYHLNTLTSDELHLKLHYEIIQFKDYVKHAISEKKATRETLIKKLRKVVKLAIDEYDVTLFCILVLLD
jgi:hypothetical protein